MSRLRTLLLVVLLPVLLFSSMASAQEVTLTVVIDSRPTYQAWQKRVIEEYERQNPHIKVETIVQAGSVTQQQLTLFMAGVPFDMGFTDPHAITAWGRMGLLTDLTPYITEHADQYADWYPSALDFYRVGDGIYALPVDIQLGTVFYNVDAFSQVGLPHPDPNWTYFDLQDYARRLLVTDAEGNVLRHGFKIPTWRNWVPMVWAFGADYVDDWNNPTRFTGNTPEMVQALTYLNDLVVTQAVQDQATHRRYNTFVAFSGGHAAMVLSNSISMYQFQEIKDFEWDVAAMPHGPAGQVTHINAIGWFIPATSQYPDEAWGLLQLMTSPEALEWLIEMVQTVPPSRSAIVSNWLPSITVPKSKEIMLMGVENARAPGTLAAEIYNPISDITHAVIWGEIPPTAAIENMERLVSVLLTNQ